MGLDMYLNRETYVGANYEFNEVKGVVSIVKGNKKLPIKLKDVKYITTEAVYWRKANQIHRWFINTYGDGKDDGRDIYIPKEGLKELLQILYKVKELLDTSEVIITKEKVKIGYKDGKDWYEEQEIKRFSKEDKIRKILPPQAGFFFGSTDVDEYYEEDIEYSIKELEREIESGYYKDENTSYYYRASW